MKLVTSEQMKFLEKTAIDDFGVPSLILMENAAMGFCTELKKHIDLENKSIGVFCGKGNNGGDGFAIARLLHNDGFKVSCVLSFDKNNAEDVLTKDAYTNFCILEKMDIPLLDIKDADEKYDIIIDAVLGTGLNGEPRAKETELIEFINNSNAFVVSVDVPSGAEASNGKVFGACVRAELTITFALAKAGHFIYPAKEYVGKLSVVPISVPLNVIDSFESKLYTLTDEIFSYLPKRKENSHKGTYGKVLAYCGCSGMSGAAMMSCSAALKSGAGMVSCASGEDVLKNVVINTPEVMTVSLDSEDAEEKLLETLDRNDALLIGCGIGRSEKAQKLTNMLIEKSIKPIIIDADGINNLSTNIDILYKKKAPVILTPHTVEFSRLTGINPSEIEENRLKFSVSFAKKYDIILVLKGADTIVASPDGTVYISAISNSGLATAGSGDVLSGVIAGFLAQGAEPLVAATCGVYTHSIAGVLARDEHGEKSMTASDVISNISKVLLRTK